MAGRAVQLVRVTGSGTEADLVALSGSAHRNTSIGIGGDDGIDLIVAAIGVVVEQHDPAHACHFTDADRIGI